MKRRAPTGPTPAITAQFAAMLRAGAPLILCCVVAVVTERTVRTWLSKGRKPGAPSHYQAFAAAVDKARAEHAAEVDQLVRARMRRPAPADEEGGSDAYH